MTPAWRAMARPTVVVVAILAGIGLRAQTPVRQPLPVPDIPGYRTLKADFHLHTVFSDGNVWPTVHVQDAWRDGLDVMAFTEHAEYHPHASDVNEDISRSFTIAKPLADQLGLILVPGIEITKPDPPRAPLVLPEGSAHFNALFVTDWKVLNVPDDLMEALRRAKAQNAFVFWNHPRYRVSRAQWFPRIARAFDAGLFNGMELVNGPDFYDESYAWIDEHRLTILADSDAHDPVPPRNATWHRPITLLFAKTVDIDGVRDALASRRTAAWLGDDVWGAEEHLRALWTAAVLAESQTLDRKGGLALRLRNTSSIPMKISVRQAPDWLVLTPPLQLNAESTTIIRPQLTGTAPAGDQRVELTLEVTNLHTGPGGNLLVKVPLTIR